MKLYNESNDYIDYLQNAKQKLKELLKNAGYSTENIDSIIKRFNWFVDAPDFRLEDFKTSDDDYSWFKN